MQSTTKQDNQASLAAKLQEQAEKMQTMIPDQTMEVIAKEGNKLASLKLEANFPKPGEIASDFELPSITGKNIKLYDQLKDKNVVLVFYRGGWCPYCSLELRAYQAYLEDFKKDGAVLIAISPELPDKASETAGKNQLNFEVLYDKASTVAKKYNLVFKLTDELIEIYKQLGIDVESANGDDSNELPVPATLVIDRDKTIRYVFADIDYTKRAEPSEILKVLKQI